MRSLETAVCRCSRRRSPIAARLDRHKGNRVLRAARHAGDSDDRAALVLAVALVALPLVSDEQATAPATSPNDYALGPNLEAGAASKFGGPSSRQRFDIGGLRGSIDRQMAPDWQHFGQRMLIFVDPAESK
jgi:hypothetical protein